MSNRAKITEFRALLVDIATDLRREEVKDLRALSQVHVTTERLLRIDNYDIHDLLLALEESGAISEGDMSFLVACLRRINRSDLARKIEEFLEEKRRQKLRVLYKVFGIGGPTCLFILYWASPRILPLPSNHLNNEILKLILNQIAELKEEFSKIKSLDYSGLSYKTIVVGILLAVLLLVCLYQRFMPCSSYRMKKCREGSIPGHVMTFVMTTFDMQTPLVRGLEFHWEDLVKKLNLDFKPHPNPGVHYYLNYDRCGAGGVRHVASWFDGLPMIRGAEVFAVDEDATKVWYNMNDSWHIYQSAREIKCSHHGIKKYNLTF